MMNRFFTAIVLAALTALFSAQGCVGPLISGSDGKGPDDRDLQLLAGLLERSAKLTHQLERHGPGALNRFASKGFAKKLAPVQPQAICGSSTATTPQEPAEKPELELAPDQELAPLFHENPFIPSIILQAAFKEIEYDKSHGKARVRTELKNMIEFPFAIDVLDTISVYNWVYEGGEWRVDGDAADEFNISGAATVKPFFSKSDEPQKIDPRLIIEYLTKLGQMYDRENKKELELETFARLFTIDPENTIRHEPWPGKDAGPASKSIEEYGNRLEYRHKKFPEAFAVVDSIVRFDIWRGQTDNSRQVLIDSIPRLTTDLDNYRLISDDLYLLGAYRESVDVFTRGVKLERFMNRKPGYAVESYPERADANPELIYLLAKGYIIRGDNAKALVAIRTALKIEGKLDRLEQELSAGKNRGGGTTLKSADILSDAGRKFFASLPPMALAELARQLGAVSFSSGQKTGTGKGWTSPVDITATSMVYYVDGLRVAGNRSDVRIGDGPVEVSGEQGLRVIVLARKNKAVHDRKTFKNPAEFNKYINTIPAGRITVAVVTGTNPMQSPEWLDGLKQLGACLDTPLGVNAAYVLIGRKLANKDVQEGRTCGMAIESAEMYVTSASLLGGRPDDSSRRILDVLAKNTTKIPRPAVYFNPANLDILRVYFPKPAGGAK